ncbi:MAG: arsenate reductase [Bacteroidetes bacterium]|nr:arsenate reductase [Bacteroidota bacterium]
MNKVYHLTHCGTCQRIIRDLGLVGKGFAIQDIKVRPILPEELDGLASIIGGYEPLFSRRAIQYKTRGLAGQSLTEADYRRYILEDYTFLKRPVVVVGDGVFAGSERKTLEALRAVL